MAITNLIKGKVYTASTTYRNATGMRKYREVTFAASRDQEVEPFIRDRESTVDQDRVFRAEGMYGESGPLLVVAGSIEEAN